MISNRDTFNLAKKKICIQKLIEKSKIEFEENKKLESQVEQNKEIVKAVFLQLRHERNCIQKSLDREKELYEGLQKSHATQELISDSLALTHTILIQDGSSILGEINGKYLMFDENDPLISDKVWETIGKIN